MLYGRLFCHCLTLSCLLTVTAAAADRLGLVPFWQVYSSESKGPLNHPEGVACRGDRLVVADSVNGRLLLYSLTRDRVSGGSVCELPQLKFPIRVHIGPTGEIFVQDGKLHAILRLKADGEFLGVVKPSGLPTDATVMVKSFALDNAGQLYVLDLFGSRVLRLDADGKYLGEIPLPQVEGGFFSDIAVDTKGTIFLLDTVKAVVYTAAKDAKAFAPMGESFREYANFPTHITTDKRGLVYVVDQHAGELVLLDQRGTFKGHSLTMGWKPGLVYFPAQVCVTENDDLIVADRGNSRIQIYRINR